MLIPMYKIRKTTTVIYKSLWNPCTCLQTKVCDSVNVAKQKLSNTKNMHNQQTTLALRDILFVNRCLSVNSILPPPPPTPSPLEKVWVSTPNYADDVAFRDSCREKEELSAEPQQCIFVNMVSLRYFGKPTGQVKIQTMSEHQLLHKREISYPTFSFYKTTLWAMFCIVHAQEN